MDYASATTKFVEAIQGLNSIFKKKDTIRNNNLQLLEPLTSVTRLAMLCFEAVGTKIAIYNNSITLQSPGLTQGVMRSLYGNKRNELHNLYKPIIMATQYYNYETNKHIQAIFDFAVQGLEKLAKTYSEHENDIVCHSIKLYKDILGDPKNSQEVLEKISEGDITLPLYKQFHELWNDEQIVIIASLLKEASHGNSPGNNVEAFLDAIDQILRVKENASIKIINTFTINLTKPS
jgi:hypothetical protein